MTDDLGERVAAALQWTSENLAEHEPESAAADGPCVCGAPNWPCAEFEDLQLLDAALGGNGYNTLQAPARRRTGLMVRSELENLTKRGIL